MKVSIAHAPTKELRLNMFRGTEKGWCPRCKTAVDYGCACPGGRPEFPLLDRSEIKKEQYQKIVMAAVDAVYNDFCSNSVADLQAAVVDLIGVPLVEVDDED